MVVDPFAGLVVSDGAGGSADYGPDSGTASKIPVLAAATSVVMSDATSVVADDHRPLGYVAQNDRPVDACTC